MRSHHPWNHISCTLLLSVWSPFFSVSSLPGFRPVRQPIQIRWTYSLSANSFTHEERILIRKLKRMSWVVRLKVRVDFGRSWLKAYSKFACTVVENRSEERRVGKVRCVGDR